MDKEKVNMFLLSNAQMFPGEKMPFLKEQLEKMDDSKYDSLITLNFKNPETIQILSILLGGFGVDRFMIGDIGLGVLKLLTLGCCGIFSIVDWFKTAKRAREKNLNMVLTLV